jgi:4-amino-4-deoxy-L-arabinose transferase-like glycosyltransferase
MKTALHENQPMSRVAAILLVLAVWAAIYLPALGSLAIKGEEGRRILPAVRMLETGDYMVPQVGSEPYLRKPPLINWLVAASFKIFGHRNEWTARLPSALSVLAVAIAFITVARASLGASGSTIAALIWLTNFGMIEKGRLIEIEALYVSLFAIAFICWISGWEQGRPPWLTWILPWIFLGLGWLAKGPTHLFFFYAIVFAVLWRSRELRKIWNIPHLIGLIIMISIFAAWAIPFAKIAGAAHVTHVWSRQFSGRLAGEGFNSQSWALNIPRSLGYFLPWLFFMPLLLNAKFSSERKIDIADGLSWGIVIPLVIVDLIPGSLPRYAMPLLAPAAWLLAETLTAENLTWPRWLAGRQFQRKDRVRTVAFVTIATCACILLYAVAIVPHLQSRQKLRTIAARIDDLIPANESLYAVDPDYQPILFYVERKLIYIGNLNELPADAHFFLVQPELEHAALGRASPALRIKDYRNREVILMRR